MAEMATDETGITPIFADFQKYLTADQELREVVNTFILQRSTSKKNLPTPLIDIVESRNIA